MSWDGTESILRFYMFGEDSASAYVLHHQMSTVLEFWTRDRQGFGGSCFGTRKTIGVKEVHLITNGFDHDVKMAEEISNFYCSTTPEII